MKRNTDKKKSKLSLATTAALSAALIAGTYIALAGPDVSSDPVSTSAMILDSSGRSGGSGVVIQSSRSLSMVLTNSHVCEVVKAGGIVRTVRGEYQVSKYVQSSMSDLCLVSVAADLHAAAKIAKQAPSDFSSAEVVGHPTLLPTISTKGQFAGRKTIEVMTGVRPCTEEEKRGPFGLACLFVGGMPLVRRYEANIVTATIMPGSSGSPVFNSSGEVAAIVFAGMGGLSYAFTVPLEQVLNFLETETKTLEEKTPKTEFAISELPLQAGLKKGRSKCKKGDKKNEWTCKLIERSSLWVD